MTEHQFYVVKSERRGYMKGTASYPKWVKSANAAKIYSKLGYAKNAKEKLEKLGTSYLEICLVEVKIKSLTEVAEEALLGIK